MTSLPKNDFFHNTFPLAGNVADGFSGPGRVVRFPEGAARVACRPAERAFAEYYIRDIQLCIDSNPLRWSDWRESLADDGCPVLEFDPDWFSFLLPPKEQTRLELFAWYWLWIDSDRRLSIPHYAFLELYEAFEAARRFRTDDAGLANAVRRVNAALEGGEGGAIACVPPEIGIKSESSRIEGKRLWFPGLLIDFDPSDSSPEALDTDAEATVWGYLVSGGTGLDRVSGQVRALRREGRWTFEPGAVRAYRQSVGGPGGGMRSALSD